MHFQQMFSVAIFLCVPLSLSLPFLSFQYCFSFLRYFPVFRTLPFSNIYYNILTLPPPPSPLSFTCICSSLLRSSAKRSTAVLWRASLSATVCSNACS